MVKIKIVTFHNCDDDVVALYNFNAHKTQNIMIITTNITLYSNRIELEKLR